MRNAKVLGITALLLVLFVIMSVLVPESFLTANNFENLLRRTALHGILGIGVAFVIITSGIDLSIGSVVCLAGCLLALFLEVNYVPPDAHPVLQVRAEERQLVVDSETDDFRAGDQIRYFGGRRAETAVRSVENVEHQVLQLQGESRPVTIVTVDQPFSRNDSVGSVAKVYPVNAYQSAAATGDGPAMLDIGGSLTLNARDHVQLIDVASGSPVRDYVIDESHSGESSTRVALRDVSDRDVDTRWVAMPLLRNQRMPVLQGVLFVLAIGAALGLVHGLLITKVHLQPFVVTLCGLLIYRGVSRWLVNDQPRGFADEYDHSLMPLVKGKVAVQGLGGSDLFGIPIPFFILLGIAVLAAIFLGQTIWGRYMLALGKSREAAEYSGINTDRMTILAYILCTVLAAVGGMLFALDANSVSPSSFGNFFELYAIAAAVLGGCSLRGGEGGIFGVVIGAALMQTLKNLILLLHISGSLEFAIIGGVILVGVMVDEVLRSWAKRRRALA